MRYALAVAALVAGVVAVPYNKRDLVTDVDVVYETQYVTVTAGQEPTTTSKPAATTKAHWGHRPHKWTKTEINLPTTTPAPAPVPATTYEAPAPEITSYPVPEVSIPAVSIPAAAPTDYSGKVVLHHNLHRANHSAPALEWDEGLAATAAKIAAGCVYAHDVTMDNGGYGQNIAAGVSSDNIASVITDLFYNGEVDYFDGLYGQASPDMSNFEKWGHFSQIVWKGTTAVGCATQDCSAGGLANTNGGISPYFTVCNYKSPGNYAGEYADNIGDSLRQASITSSYGS